MKKFLHLLKNKKYLIVIIAVVLVVIVLLVSRKNNTALETITVPRADFINQVSVSGKVIPSESVDLGFYQGGRISSIKANTGEYVSSLAVIASIENGDLIAALDQKQATLLREQAKLKSLQLGIRPEQIAITESSLVSAQTSFDQARTSLINSISDAYTKSDDAIKNKIDQFFQNPLTNNPTIVISTPDSDLISRVNFDRASVGTMLSSWKKSISQITDNTNLDINVSEAQDNLNQMKSFLAEVSSITNNTGSTYLGSSIPSIWKSDTSVARLNVDTTISSLSSSATLYRSAQTAVTTAQNTLKLEQAGATAEDLQGQEAQVKSAEADVVNGQAMLEKTLVRAPFSGQITKMDAKVGEIVSPNTSLISMMSAGTFQIESYIPEVNISKIKLAQNAKVTLDAYGESVVFNAKIISIDPAETIRDGVSTYKTKLQFTDKDDRVKSGMTANVSVVVFEKPNTLTIPEGVIYEKDGKKFVQVKNGDDVLEREITTGEKSSLGQVEVLSGISEGEAIILKPKIN